MNWGTSMVGFGSTMAALRDLKIQFGDDAVWIVGTNVEYSVYVEFGTARMEAQPYLFRAARQVSRSVERIARATNPDSTDELVKVIAAQIEALASRFAPVDTGNLMNSITAEKVR